VTAVVWSLDEVSVEPSVVTIGNFDGVHRGHHVLLRRTVDTGRDRDLRSVVVTFEPHPAAVLRPGSEPPRLQTLDDRIEALAATEVDLVVVLPFTRELSALTPREFVERVLVEGLGVARVVVGTNFRFGHRAAGDVVTLVEVGEDHGFETEAVTLLELGDAAVSSSQIRTALRVGDVERAAGWLGRPYTLRGTVVRGDGRGRTIGVPTANLAVDPDVLVPADGVYAGRVEHGGRRYDAVTNVGVRPTFDGVTRSIEAHVLDASPDLYGESLTVAFEARIRGEQRFDGPDELVARIRLDIEEARQVLAARG
jgi:riboflavin kinase / FMN adenylyltransferase